MKHDVKLIIQRYTDVTDNIDKISLAWKTINATPQLGDFTEIEFTDSPTLVDLYELIIDGFNYLLSESKDIINIPNDKYLKDYVSKVIENA